MTTQISPMLAVSDPKAAIAPFVGLRADLDQRVRLRRPAGPAQPARVRVADRRLAVDHELIRVRARVKLFLDPPQAALVDRQRIGLHVPVIEIANQMNAVFPGCPERKRDRAIASITRSIRRAGRRSGHTRCLRYHMQIVSTSTYYKQLGDWLKARSVPPFLPSFVFRPHVLRPSSGVLDYPNQLIYHTYIATRALRALPR